MHKNLNINPVRTNVKPGEVTAKCVLLPFFSYMGLRSLCWSSFVSARVEVSIQ